MAWGNKSIYKWSRSHNQDGRHAPYMVKTFKNPLQNQKSNDLETWHVALGTQALQSLYKWGKLLQSHLFDENLQQRTLLTEKTANENK